MKSNPLSRAYKPLCIQNLANLPLSQGLSSCTFLLGPCHSSFRNTLLYFVAWITPTYLSPNDGVYICKSSLTYQTELVILFFGYTHILTCSVSFTYLRVFPSFQNMNSLMEKNISLFIWHVFIHHDLLNSGSYW